MKKIKLISFYVFLIILVTMNCTNKKGSDMYNDTEVKMFVIEDLLYLKYIVEIKNRTFKVEVVNGQILENPSYLAFELEALEKNDAERDKIKKEDSIKQNIDLSHYNAKLLFDSEQQSLHALDFKVETQMQVNLDSKKLNIVSDFIRKVENTIALTLKKDGKTEHIKKGDVDDLRNLQNLKYNEACAGCRFSCVVIVTKKAIIVLRMEIDGTERKKIQEIKDIEKDMSKILDFSPIKINVPPKFVKGDLIGK